MPQGYYLMITQMERVKIQDQFHGPIYRWDDIHKIIMDGLIEKVPQFDHDYSQNACYSGEDYGSFTPSDQEDPDQHSWSELGVWLQSCENGNMESLEWNISPYIAEVLLFREFRYRFDPAWQPEESSYKNLREYIHFARHWARHSYWNERPWRVQNFPRQPRSPFIFPKFTTLTERINDPSFKSYQFHSAKLRALLGAFPDILRSPLAWRRCMVNEMRDIPIKEAVEIALEEKNSWTEPKLKDFEFEIRKDDENLDIHFVRRGRNLKFETSICNGVGNPRNGEVWKMDIIQVKGEMVRTQSRTMIGGASRSFRRLLDG